MYIQLSAVCTDGVYLVDFKQVTGLVVLTLTKLLLVDESLSSSNAFSYPQRSVNVIRLDILKVRPIK